MCAWLVIEFSLLCRIYSSNSTLQCGSIFRIISKPFPTKEIDYHADVQTAWQFDAHQNLIDKMKIINDCSALLRQLQDTPPWSLRGRWCSVTSLYWLNLILLINCIHVWTWTLLLRLEFFLQMRNGNEPANGKYWQNRFISIDYHRMSWQVKENSLILIKLPLKLMAFTDKVSKYTEFMVALIRMLYDRSSTFYTQYWHGKQNSMS